MSLDKEKQEDDPTEGDDSEDKDEDPEEEEESDESEDKEESEEEESEEEDEEEEAESEEESEEEEEETSEPDPSKMTPAELLEANEALRREVQSRVDRGRTAERRKVQDEARLRRQQRADQTEQDELDELLEGGDFEGYGRKKAEKDKTAKARLTALGEAQVDIASGLKERYTKLLGETGYDEVITELDNDHPQGYSVIDLTDALARKYADRDLDTRIAKALEDKKTEEEADNVEARAKKRSKKVAKKKTASANVSSTRRAKTVRREQTDAELEDGYGDGLVPFEDLPDHLKEKYGG